MAQAAGRLVDVLLHLVHGHAPGQQPRPEPGQQAAVAGVASLDLLASVHRALRGRHAGRPRPSCSSGDIPATSPHAQPDRTAASRVGTSTPATSRAADPSGRPQDRAASPASTVACTAPADRPARTATSPRPCRPRTTRVVTTPDRAPSTAPSAAPTISPASPAPTAAPAPPSAPVGAPPARAATTPVTAPTVALTATPTSTQAMR
ncbi:hypothetical protein [Ornithinimicrobium kibberense]|uniref:hypothetical protein n=1 Tax=Ornithinimicrobium kibberense TaxID=282060 RepID=UPI003614D0F1